MAATETVTTALEKGLEYLRSRISIEAAYLFGSQVTGETHADSDIDLAIFTPDVDGLNLVERVHLTSQLALGCDSSLELHLMPSRALADARPSNFAGYIVAHGKRLI